MKSGVLPWQGWALLSAGFAALTAIFAKIGIENINADFATFIRTIVILVVLAGILAILGEFQPLDSISGRSYVFLVLSGLATGASWLCYFRALKLGNAAQVAPIDKLSVVLVALFRRYVPRGAVIGSQLGRHRIDRRRSDLGWI